MAAGPHDAGARDATAEASTAPKPTPDAGRPPEPDASSLRDAAADGGGGEISEPAGGAGGAGHAGTVQPAGGTGGGDAAAEQGGSEQPTGGSTAPAEHVLWSQTFNVAIHSAVAHPGVQNAKMGLFIDGGDGCRFWQSEPADSGTTQTVTTDATCIHEVSARASALIFDGTTAKGFAGTTSLSGWDAAVSGHYVSFLRRTQTYTISVQGADSNSFNYADFTATLEVVGN